MKFYISADIEGTCGCMDWDHTMGNSIQYQIQKNIMTNEVKSCVSAIIENHPDCEIIINDAHYLGNNLDITVFPDNCKIIRGWSHNPHSMVEGLDDSYDGIFFIGYHNAAGTGSTPLAHTFNGSKFQKIKLNDQICSEFLFNYYIALHHGVPTILLSGDKGLCDQINKINSNIRTVYSYEGFGNAILTKTPSKVVSEIYENTLDVTLQIPKINPLKKSFSLEIEYKKSGDCYRALALEKAKRLNDNTLLIEATDILEIERLFEFL